MRRRSGNVYDAVIAEMKRRGLPTEKVGVKRPGGGQIYWIVVNDRVVGEYNYLTRILEIWAELEDLV